MNAKVKKIWNIVTSVVVVLVVILAVLLAGARIFGLKMFTVLSSSMEPTYHTGSVIYVKPVDTATLKEGDPITYMLNEDTVSTHRIVEVVTDSEDGELRFVTKGDANPTNDPAPVHHKNVIGKPVFSIPYLGFVSSFIQTGTGKIVAGATIVLLILLIFIPDIFKEKKPN